MGSQEHEMYPNIWPDEAGIPSFRSVRLSPFLVCNLYNVFEEKRMVELG